MEKLFEVTGVGYEPKGEFKLGGRCGEAWERGETSA